MGLLDMLGISPQAGGGLGLLGQLGQGLHDNSGMLMGFATGGPEGALQGKRMDLLAAKERKDEEDKRKRIAAYQEWASKNGGDPQVASLMSADPELGRALAADRLKKPSFEERIWNTIPEDQRGAAAMAKFGLNKDPMLTDDLKEYRVYATQAAGAGQQPQDFTTWMRENKKAGATNVNVNPGEKGYDNTVGTGYGKTFLEMQDQGRKAPVTIGTLDTMEKLMDTPGFYSGTNADLNMKFKQGLAALGGDPKAPASMETFRSLSNQSIFNNLGSLGNGISEGDRKFITSSQAGLDNTPGGNKQMIGIAKALEQRKLQVSQLARQYAASHGGRLDAGFDEALAQWAEQNPLFSNTSANGGLGVGQSATIGGMTIKRTK